jgi:hypothetical protein
VIRPKARRDFVLDSGALSHLAERQERAKAWFAHIGSAYEEPAVVVPVPVLTESLTGNPAHDASVRRLLRLIEASAGPDGHWLQLTPEAAARAAVLRTAAIRRRSGASPKRLPSAIDAQVVALAEERSAYNAVTILTTDRLDIQLLVDLTGATNMAVQVV